MRFVSVRELNTKPKEIWSIVKDEEVVITSNGKPLPFFQGLRKRHLKGPSAPVRRSRALIALEEMQKKVS